MRPRPAHTNAPVQALENRTLDSRREMDIMTALDELQSLNQRHNHVTPEAALAAIRRSGGVPEAGGHPRAAAPPRVQLLVGVCVVHGSGPVSLRLMSRLQQQPVSLQSFWPGPHMDSAGVALQRHSFTCIWALILEPQTVPALGMGRASQTVQGWHRFRKHTQCSKRSRPLQVQIRWTTRTRPSSARWWPRRAAGVLTIRNLPQQLPLKLHSSQRSSQRSSRMAATGATGPRSPVRRTSRLPPASLGLLACGQGP